MIFLSLITQVSTLQSENGTPNKSNKRQARTGGETTTPFSPLDVGGDCCVCGIMYHRIFLPLTVVSLYDSFPQTEV